MHPSPGASGAYTLRDVVFGIRSNTCTLFVAHLHMLSQCFHVLHVERVMFHTIVVAGSQMFPFGKVERQGRSRWNTRNFGGYALIDAKRPVVAASSASAVHM